MTKTEKINLLKNALIELNREDSLLREICDLDSKKVDYAKLAGEENAEVIIDYEISNGTILVSSLKFPNRVQHQFAKDGILTLIDLCNLTVEQLLCMRNIGKVSLKAIHDEMDRIGIRLKPQAIKPEPQSKELEMSHYDLYAYLEPQIGQKNAVAIIKYRERKGTIHINSLNLPSRITDRFISDDMITLVDLCKQTTEDLMMMRTVGKKSVELLLNELEKEGLSLNA